MKGKLAVLVEPGRFEISEREFSPKDDEILVKVVSCGLCTWELFHWKGEYGSCPQVIGHEPAGIVVESGKNIAGFKPGDRITGLEISQSFSEYVLANPKCLVKVPESINLKYAIGEPLSCIVNIVRATQVEVGDYVAVIGCGFMGLLCLSLLSGFVKEIIAIDIKEYNLKLASDFGATVTINPKKENVEDRIKEITNGRGVDVAVEATGKVSGIEVGSKILKTTRGKLILSGAHSREDKYDPYLWEEKGTIVLSVHPSYSLNQMDDLRRAIGMLEKGKFPMEKVVSHEFKLEDIQKAFKIHESKPEGYIKGLVIP